MSLQNYSDRTEFLGPTHGAIFLAIYGCILGASLTLLALSICAFRRRKSKNSTSWCFFVLSTLGLLALLAFSAIQIRLRNDHLSRVMSIFDPDLESRLQASMVSAPSSLQGSDALWTAQLVIQLYIPVLSDTAILLRAAMISDRKSLKIVLMMLGIIYTSGTIYILLYLRVIRTSNDLSRWITDNQITFMCYILFSMSSLCNIFATGTVALRLWLHRKYLRVELGFSRMGPTNPQRVLTFLIESGTAFSIFHVAFLCLLGTPGLHRGIGLSISLSRTILLAVTGIYPSMIFFILNLQVIGHNQAISWTLESVKSQVLLPESEGTTVCQIGLQP